MIRIPRMQVDEVQGGPSESGQNIEAVCDGFTGSYRVVSVHITD